MRDTSTLKIFGLCVLQEFAGRTMKIGALYQLHTCTRQSLTMFFLPYTDKQKSFFQKICRWHATSSKANRWVFAPFYETQLGNYQFKTRNAISVTRLNIKHSCAA